MTLQWAVTATALIETGCLNSYDLATLAARAESDIIAELDMNGLDTNPLDTVGSGVGMLKTAAQNWLCRNIRIEQKHDGTFPNSLSVGVDRQDVTIDASIKYYDDKGRLSLDKYINSKTGTDDDDTDELTGLLALAGEEF